MQSSITGGTYLDDQRIRFNGGLSFWFTRDSSFTSAQIAFEPVFTNRSIRRNINELSGNIYREDYWFDNHWLQTGLNLSGSWYSNDVFEYAVLARFYVTLPISTRFSKVRPIADFSYSEATKSYPSGVPYYTPDNLFTKGLGIEYSYKDALYDPVFSASVELMTKHDNRDGFYFTGSARLSARIHRYWQLSLQGDVSSSNIYRYNKIGIGISYIFPKALD